MEEINTEESIENIAPHTEITASKKKKYLMYGAGILITLMCIGGGGFYFLKYLPQKNAIIGEMPLSKNSGAPLFYNLNEFIVNLNKVNNQTNFLKISLTFQLQPGENVAKIEEKLPIIIDTFQIYLRELKAEDIQGSAGIFLLKQELLLRVNKILYPIKIIDVLFRDLLIQ